MLLNFVSAFILLLELAYAIIPDIKNVQAEQQRLLSHDEPGHLSLPNLLHTKDVSDLVLNWETYNDVLLDTGRLLIKRVGSIWSIPQLENSQNEWTIEVLFRSSGTHEDMKFASLNGLSFWLINPSNSLPINAENTNNFGGPSNYDGFHFLFNNHQKKGLKIFNNDGTKSLPNAVENSIGDCTFNFLDSQVPFTLRISYSRTRSWFKVQVDNNLCFKTDKIVIPENSNDFKFGISGQVNPESKEQFEIFKLNVWPHLTEDAIDDHGLMADGHIEDRSGSNTQKTQEYSSPNIIRQSLMEKTRQHRDILEQQAFDHNNNEKIVDLIVELNDKFEKLDRSMDTIDRSKSNEAQLLMSQINELKLIQAQQKETLTHLENSILEFKTSLAQQYSQMLDAVAKLNDKVIGEVREQQFGTDELSKKVDLLMTNHKEIAYQYQKQESNVNSDSNFFRAIVKWILIPVVVGIIVLTIIITRLRHDIKHSKLL